MEVICFALGIIIGAGIGCVCAFFIVKDIEHKKDTELFEQKRREEENKEKQMKNFWAYNGSEEGQEEVN